MTVIPLSKLPTCQHPALADAVAMQALMAVLCLRDVTILTNIQLDPVTQRRMTHYTISAASFDDNRLADCGGYPYLKITLTSKFALDSLAYSSYDEIKQFIVSQEFLNGASYRFMFCNLANVLAFNDNRMLVSFREISQKIIDAMPGPVNH